VRYTSTVLPIAVSVALSTIQCVYMAHNAGDDFDVRMSMLGDGTVTMIAALFGSPFGMTVFIGHPALKEGKAQGGYLLLTSAFFGVISFCGFSKLILTLVSIDSLNPVLLFVGAVVCCDTLSTTPIRHYPAFIIGLMPSLCDWASELGPAADVLHNGTVVYAVQPAMAGVLLLKGGAMLVSVMWTASLVCMIDRLYLQMAFWTALAALLSLVGLVHNDKMGWYTASHDKGWRFAVGYGSIALSALAFKLLQMRGILDSPYTDDVEEEDLDVKVAYRSSLYDPKYQTVRDQSISSFITGSTVNSRKRRTRSHSLTELDGVSYERFNKPLNEPLRDCSLDDERLIDDERLTRASLPY